MTKELMDDKLKKEVAFVIRLNNNYKNRIYEVIKDIKRRYGSRFCYIFTTDDDTTLLLVCDRKFSFYADVLAKAIKSKDKMLLDYIICTINSRSREGIRKYFKSHIEEQEADDKKEEAKKSSDTSNEIGNRKSPIEIMDKVMDGLDALASIEKEQPHNKKEIEKSDDEEVNIPYFIDFVKTSKDILKKYGYHEYRKYYPKVYGVNNRKTFILCHDFDMNITKMYLHLVRSNDTSVIDTMYKYCDEILYKYGAKNEKEKDNIKKIFHNIIQSMIVIHLIPSIPAHTKIYKIKDIIANTYKDASLFSNYPDELYWLMYHMILIIGVISSKRSNEDRMNIINTICKNMINLLYSDKFPNEMIGFSEYRYLFVYERKGE